MPKFLLKKGAHVVGSGDEVAFYHANDPLNNIVESDEDLAKADPGKWEDVRAAKDRQKLDKELSDAQARIAELENELAQKKLSQRIEDDNAKLMASRSPLLDDDEIDEEDVEDDEEMAENTARKKYGATADDEEEDDEEEEEEETPKRATKKKAAAKKAPAKKLKKG